MSSGTFHSVDTPPIHPRRGVRDWMELMGKDHGFLRLGWHNLHQIDKRMWRSNQPTPGRIESYAKMGIKTIINLRGEREDGGWRLEAEACHAHKITLVDFTARSRAAPDKKMLHDTAALFSKVEMPALLHCKSGADRAGLMSALYVLLCCNGDVDKALEQLTFTKHLHVSQAKTGLLDAFLKSYRPYQQKGVPFFQWVDEIYDPETLQREFISQGWANRLIDDLLKRE